MNKRILTDKKVKLCVSFLHDLRSSVSLSPGLTMDAAAAQAEPFLERLWAGFVVESNFKSKVNET